MVEAPTGTGLRRSGEQILKDLAWGAGWGFLAGFIAPFLIVVMYARGPAMFGGIPVLFWMLGIGSGLLLGLLRPLNRTLIGELFIAFIVCVPVAALTFWNEMAKVTPIRFWLTVLAIAAIMGPIYGFIWRMIRKFLAMMYRKP